MSRRNNWRRSSSRFTVKTKMTAWLFTIVLLLMGGFFAYTGKDMLGYVLIGAGIILGGYKVLKQHW